MIDNTRPSFSSIEKASGTTVGHTAYNTHVIYNSHKLYGGFTGGVGPGPKNYSVSNYKPNL